MTDLIVRGIPAEVHSMLKERAAQNRRSMNQELLALLEEALLRGRYAPEEPPTPFAGRFMIDDEWIREAREEGRA
jgi:plasmid stability protein